MDGESIVTLMATITLIFAMWYLSRVIKEEKENKEKDKKAQH